MMPSSPKCVMKTEFTLENINAEQEAAILAINGPSLVIAGPGSGKTQTLTAKALYILKRQPEGANPVHDPHAKSG